MQLRYTLEWAREQVLADLRKDASITDREYVILDDKTITLDFGWVFFYDSAKHLATGDVRHCLVGAGPIIVDGRDGSMHECKEMMSTQAFIEDYRKRTIEKQNS